MGAVFLSASIPTPGRAPYDQDIEPLAIQSAVSALASVVLGRRLLVWGGHPAITPMLWASARDMGVRYAQAVHLFQSAFFAQEDFPAENERFANVTYVPAVDNDLPKSLQAMREAMMQSADFEAAVFIGGMEGILHEHELFIKLHPNAKCLPVAMTGGASRRLSGDLHYTIPADVGPLDFVRLFHRELAISPLERRQPSLPG